jgi:polyisoprenoid-binding protein YceI
MTRTIPSCVLPLVLGAAAVADAAELRVVPNEQSSLTFVYKQMGVPVEGRFTKFSAQVSFDPAAPAAAKAALELDLTSVDAGSTEANDELAGKAWFDTKAHPKATFVAEDVRPTGDNRYELRGKITVKGQTRAVSAPFTFTPRGDAALFEGAFVLERAAFAIGDGIWADFGTVANEVQVKFRFLATAGK